MSPTNVEDIYPLSPMQQGILFHSLYAPESGVYLEQGSWMLRGSLDTGAFQRAWQKAVERHPSLRTAFVSEGVDEPLQVVTRQVSLPFDVQDWRGLPAHQQTRRVEAYLQADREKGFDLASAPLMRLGLIRLSEDTTCFTWSHHHLILDGWSLPILVQEVFRLYEADLCGETIVLEPPHRFREYIAWLKKQDRSAAEAYWRRELAGFSAPTSLPLKFNRAASQPETESDVVRAEGYARYAASLSESSSLRAREFCRDQGLTLNSLAIGAWSLLLERYSGEQDVVFGATTSGRPADLPGAERIVGLLINTLPVRAKIDPEAETLAWLKDLQARQADARQYEYTPLVEIQGWREIPAGLPLFETLLVVENYPVSDLIADAGVASSLEIEPGPAFRRTNYPLTFAISPGPQIGIEVAFDAGRFDAGSIKRLVGQFQTLLEGIIAKPKSAIDQLPLLTEAEEHQLFVEWNATQAPEPAERAIQRLFENQVERTPEAIAVQEGSRSLTYAELNEAANRLAHFLKQTGVTPGTLVGISLERSSEMVVAILGVLKAGAAYLPLDPAYPEERLKFMLTDSQAPLVITHSRFAEKLSRFPVRMACLDQEITRLARESAQNPPPVNQPGDLAYVIYTSGSTGSPKGVAITHRGLVNHAVHCREAFQLGPGERTLQFISLSFDAAAEELFPTLTSGATLVLYGPQADLFGGALLEFCRKERISLLHLPAYYWRQCMDDVADQEPGERLAIKTLVLGGDVVAKDRWPVWARLVDPESRLINAYGPTETTISAAMYTIPCKDAFADRDRLPIGRPIRNAHALLLDDRLRPVPIGIPGELWIGGAGVAKGYLNRPDLTSPKFVPADRYPFSQVAVDPGERFYRTGDLACYLPDGNLEFLGRDDDQVKIRGFRVELGEVEAVLSQHPQVKLCAVISRVDPSQEKRLCAAVVPKGPAVLDSGDLHRFLESRLPAYMIPVEWVQMEDLPRLPNGKIDRRALAAATPPSSETPTARALTLSPVEQGLAEIWSQLLGVTPRQKTDNFFYLGGHSILATRLACRIREVFQVELGLRDIFDAPTLAEMAHKVETVLQAGAEFALPPIEPTARDASLPLSFAQQRLWFLDQLDPGQVSYNIPLAVRLTGGLDISALEKSLNRIVDRHAVLRTSFTAERGLPVQVIAPAREMRLLGIDRCGASISPEGMDAEIERLLAEEARKPFDLASGPVLRASLVKTGNDEHILLLTFHHIAADGWSLGVFTRELAACYQAFVSGDEPRLPDLPVQYADYAAWQRQWLSGETLERQKAYWLQQLAHLPDLLDLPTDRPRPAVQTANGSIYSFSLPSELSNAVKKTVKEQNVTLFMLFLAAFQSLLARCTGQTDIPVGVPIANRPRAELEPLIGFFVNTLVFRTDLSGDPTFEELLGRVREVSLGAYAHPDLPFELLVEALQPQRNLAVSPLFQVMFTMDPPRGEPVRLPGLTLDLLPIQTGVSVFDLTLSMADAGDSLSGYIEYNTDLFDRSTIEALVSHYQTLLEGIAADPGLPLSRLPLLPPAEIRQILAFNPPPTPFPDWPVHALVEDWAAATPLAPAVEAYNTCLPYQALNDQANQLAQTLLSLGLPPDRPLAVCLPRSPQAVVALLAILKAGAAFLPLDPSYPPERLAFMLTDSRAPLLLTHSSLLPALPGTRPQTLLLDELASHLAALPTTNPGLPVPPDRLAYIIYTSGSTGLPKGTRLAHRGLANLVSAQKEFLPITPSSRVLQFAPLAYDASVWEIFGTLANGACLVLAPPEAQSDPTRLGQFLAEARISLATLPPSILRLLPERSLPDLVTLVSAGEACGADLAARFARSCRLINAYGPTETTVCASWGVVDPESITPPPIGRALPNMRLYVLDEAGELAPIGVPGELVIGGVGLAQGYLDWPELTAERFPPAPASVGGGGHVYRSGDRAKWLPDGQLAYLGRLDGQVKLRGLRVELGEIEAVLAGCPGIREAAVGLRGTGGEARLVAYLVAQGEERPAVGELRGWVRDRLPEFMLPGAWVWLDELPRTPSGKIDHRALPEHDLQEHAVIAGEYVAPRTQTETQLCQAFAELLAMDRVGVTDSFFDLGGHSLLATQAVSRIRECLHVELPLRALFEHPTVAELAAIIDDQRVSSPGIAAPVIRRAPRAAHRASRSALSEDGTRLAAGLQAANERDPRS